MIEKYLKLSHELDKKQCFERTVFEIEYLINNHEEKINTNILLKDVRTICIFNEEEYQEILINAIKKINQEQNLKLILQNDYIIIG